MSTFFFYTVRVDRGGRLLGRYTCWEIIPSVLPVPRLLRSWLGRGGRNILSWRRRYRWALENTGDLSLRAAAVSTLALQALNFALGRFQLLLQPDHDGLIRLRLSPHQILSRVDLSKLLIQTLVDLAKLTKLFPAVFEFFSKTGYFTIGILSCNGLKFPLKVFGTAGELLSFSECCPYERLLPPASPALECPL